MQGDRRKQQKRENKRYLQEDSRNKREFQACTRDAEQPPRKHVI